MNHSWNECGKPFLVTRSNVSDPALHLLVNQCTMWNHMQSFALIFVYQRDRAWHAFASCTDCIVGMITVAARHMSFSCTDHETDAPMRSIVSRLGTNVDINSNMNFVLCVRHELMVGFR